MATLWILDSPVDEGRIPGVSSPGESLLLRSGLVDAEHLDEARGFRLIHGVTISESLVALGALDEETLVEFFHRRLLVPRIDPESLDEVPASVLSLVPADMAVEFRVLPVALDAHGELVLAMADPADTHVVEEVGFFAGRPCLRAVASPSALRAAIERHYHRSLPPLPHSPSGVGRSTPSSNPPAKNPWKTPHKTPLQSMKLIAMPPEQTHSSSATNDVELVTLLTQIKPGSSIALSNSPEPREAALEGPARATDAPIPLLHTAAPPSERPHVATEVGKTPVPLLPLAELRLADSRDGVGSVLLDYLGEVARAAALLVVRRGLLVGFCARGAEVDDEALRWIAIPLDASSIFRDVVESRLPYRGPLPRTPPCLAVEAALGHRADGGLLLPICVGQRTIAVLVAAGLQAPVPDEVLQELAREAGLAYERLIRSRKP